MYLNKLVLAAGFTIKTWQRSSWAIVLTYFSLKLLVLFLFFILSSWGLFMLMFYVWIFIALCNHNLKNTLGRGAKFFLLKFEHSQFSSSRLFLVLLFCFHQNIGNIVRSWLVTQIITFLKKGLDSGNALLRLRAFHSRVDRTEVTKSLCSSCTKFWWRGNQRTSLAAGRRMLFKHASFLPYFTCYRNNPLG